MKATLSDLLQSVRIAKIDTAFVEIGDGAGVRLSSTRNACLHLVLEGQITLDHGGGVDGLVPLQAGDYAVSLGGKPQILTTGTDARVTASDYFMAVHTHDSPPTIRFGTGRAAARLLSGVFQLPVVNPLVRALPRRMVVRGQGGGGGDGRGGGGGDQALLLPDVARMAQAAHGAGATTLLTSALDTLFMQAVRVEVAALFKDGLEMVGTLDRLRIPIALSLIHSHPDRRWTLEKLAGEVGVSRSAFAAEFVAVVGEPLTPYLTRLRMTRAADMLRWQPVAVADVAWNVGYESVAAFSRAFRKYFNTSPAAYQQAQAPRYANAVAGHMHWSPFLEDQ